MTDDNDLDLFFAAARATRPAPTDALMARVVADAEAARAPRGRVPSAPAAPRWRARLATFFGTGGAFAGLAAASVAGFWIGAVQPDLLGSVWQSEAASVDLFPSLDGLLADVSE